MFLHCKENQRNKSIPCYYEILPSYEIGKNVNLAIGRVFLTKILCQILINCVIVFPLTSGPRHLLNFETVRCGAY